MSGDAAAGKALTCLLGVCTPDFAVCRLGTIRCIAIQTSELIAPVPQPYDSGSYAKIVTRDASPAGGAAKACVPNMRAAWQARAHSQSRYLMRC